jgi:hypothetical protein
MGSSGILRSADATNRLCWPGSPDPISPALRVTLDTYESMVASGRFLTVPAGRDPEGLRLPPDRDWNRLALVRGGYLLGESAAETDVGRHIRREIHARGFAIHEIDITSHEPRR